ncbi:MAG: phthiocerol/phenolphthiocerol synthesis type-I polyketide synthase [Micromonosporaceae bacterium]
MTAADEFLTANADIDAITQRIIAIWTSALGGVEVHSDSHLLDLGANSLTAVRIRSRIRTEFGKELDLAELLEYPTPRELAPVVAAAPEWSGQQAWTQLDWSAAGSTVEEDGG